MARVRRQAIIERMRRGATLSEGIYSEWKYQISGGYANPDRKAIGGDDCHKGDVERMIAKGELIAIPGSRIAYPNYKLADHLIAEAA